MAPSLDLIKTWIEHYGYWAIIVGTIIEGETILLAGGILAFWGCLDLKWVMVTAFIGSFSSDQIFFFLGRYKGNQIISRREKWRSRLEKVHRLSQRYHTAIILGFRFMYGFRLVTPLVLGTDHSINPRRFMILNGLSAACWSIIVAGGGYFLGEVSEGLLKEIKKVQGGFLIGLSLVGILGWIVWTIRIKKKRARL
jgi:membrane protein DedA with SNARE-associated domain